VKARTIITAILVGAAIGVVSVMFIGNPSPNDMPNLSPRGAQGTAASEYVNAQKAVAYYREEINRKPNVARNYIELAQIYIQEARVTALHHEYFPKAERLLDKALSLDPNDFTALSTKASMYATLHHFDEALVLARRALSLNPYHSGTYAVLIDALVEMGEYASAVRYCDSLLALRPDLRSYARASYLREIHGDHVRARQAMMMASEAGVHGQENRAWTLYTIGKLYLQEGSLDTAEWIFKGILVERPHYAFALSGIAHVRFFQQKYDEAASLLQQAWNTTPKHTFLEQLATVYRAAGKPQDAEKTIQLVLKEFTDHEKEGWNVDRKYAAFCLEQNINLPQALERAEREYRSRPNNIDVLDTYAWALFRTGRANDAVPIIERALRMGTRNATMKYHAAQIYNAVGELHKAAALLRESLTINPYVRVQHAPEVDTLLNRLQSMAQR